MLTGSHLLMFSDVDSDSLMEIDFSNILLLKIFHVFLAPLAFSDQVFKGLFQ